MTTRPSLPSPADTDRRLSNFQGGYSQNILPEYGLLCPPTQTKPSEKYLFESPDRIYYIPPQQTTFLVATSAGLLHNRTCSRQVRCRGQLISGCATPCSRVVDVELCQDSAICNIIVIQIVATCNWKQNYFRFGFLYK